MPAPDWEDLGDFFDLVDFGVKAVVRFQAGGEREIVGIFDDPSITASLGVYVSDTTDPHFLCKETDAKGIRRGDFFVLNDVVHDILRDPKLDGTGVAMLILAAQGRP